MQLIPLNYRSWPSPWWINHDWHPKHFRWPSVDRLFAPSTQKWAAWPSENPLLNLIILISIIDGECPCHESLLAICLSKPCYGCEVWAALKKLSSGTCKAPT
jgi:hypothetical protein